MRKTDRGHQNPQEWNRSTTQWNWHYIEWDALLFQQMARLNQCSSEGVHIRLGERNNIYDLKQHWLSWSAYIQIISAEET